MKNPTPKRGAGRPPVPAHLKKQSINMKLPPAWVAWLRSQDESQAVLVERALVNTFPGFRDPVDQVSDKADQERCGDDTNR